MKRAQRLPLLAALCACLPALCGAAPRLYDTGPAQDLALVRFVNAGTQPLTVHSGGAGQAASLAVPPTAPVTDYLPARSDAPVTGQWQLAAQTLPISLLVKAGGSGSAVAWADADGKLAGTSFTEAPPQFDPVRASLAFYNADARCTAGLLAASPVNAAIFENQAALATARRAVNPVKLVVQATCNGRPVEGTVDLGSLQAGQRYSVFLVPAGKGSRLIGLQDRLAR
ncbi:cell division protein FtsQ [Variovorax sp. H27-G14]|uniref:cell division protein FtsQ n=1 Tax=Variovorax sp. H27-G14 TaxID=3111914 RepID=UPI0038FCFA71